MILEKISSLLHGIKVNEYSGENLIDERSGVYRSNCSGIVLYLLKSLGHSIPVKRACDIFDYLKQDDDFQKIERFSQLRPGDIIIWKKNTIPKSGTSGHLCVLVSKTEGFRIRVFDCVKQKHDQDTRILDGIGIGECELIVKEDIPIGFIWSSKKKKTKFTKILMVRSTQPRHIDHFV